MSGYRTQSRDTDERVERMIFERLRAMSPEEKVELIRAECRAANRWALAGLRARHPEWSEERLRREVGFQRLGPELAEVARAALESREP